VAGISVSTVHRANLTKITDVPLIGEQWVRSYMYKASCFLTLPMTVNVALVFRRGEETSTVTTPRGTSVLGQRTSWLGEDMNRKLEEPYYIVGATQICGGCSFSEFGAKGMLVLHPLTC
jgi:hypothetical protein